MESGESLRVSTGRCKAEFPCFRKNRPVATLFEPAKGLRRFREENPHERAHQRNVESQTRLDPVPNDVVQQSVVMGISNPILDDPCIDLHGGVGVAGNDLVPQFARESIAPHFPDFVMDPYFEFAAGHVMEIRLELCGSSSHGVGVQAVLGEGEYETIPGGRTHLHDLIPEEEEHGRSTGANSISLAHGRGGEDVPCQFPVDHVDFKVIEVELVLYRGEEEGRFHADGVSGTVEEMRRAKDGVDALDVERIECAIAQS